MPIVILVFVIMVVIFLAKLFEAIGAIIGVILPILAVAGYVVLGIIGIFALWKLGVWIYYLTPKGKKSLADEMERVRVETENYRKKHEQEEERRRLCEQQVKNMGELQFCRALWSLDYDTVIVDTNVFMNTVKESGQASDTYLLATRFFAAIEKCKLKVHILTSQLNELSNMRRKREGDKQKKARLAVKEMLDLQDRGLLDVIGDTNEKKSYADHEIIRAVRALTKQGKKPFVITDDRDLRIRLGAEHVLRKSLDELYAAGAEDSIHIRGVHCGRKYVCMDKQCGGVLVANRDRADLWETFSLHVDGKGDYTLQSKENGKFVCADATQGGRLVARDATSGEQSAFEFELVPVAGKRSTVALKSKATGKFVSVCEDQGNVLIANGPKISDWESLEIC